MPTVTACYDQALARDVVALASASAAERDEERDETLRMAGFVDFERSDRLF
jgi:hypothetical protein